MRLLAGTSLCLGAMHFTLIYLGLERAEGITSVAVASQLFVPFSTLLSVVFLHERIGWRRILGIVLAFSGVMILGFEPSALAVPVSLAFVIAGALVAAIGTIFMKRLGDVGVFEMQAWMAFISLPLLLLASFSMESGQLAAIHEANLYAWLILVFSALGASLLGHGGMYWLIQRHDVSRISPTTLLSTIFGVGLGVAVLGEQLTARMIGGGVIALAGVLLIALRQPRRGPPPVLSQPIIATAKGLPGN